MNNQAATGGAARRAIAAVMLTTAVVVALVMGAEILLRYRAAIKDGYRPMMRAATPRFAALATAYDPFVSEYLHPDYLFSFPLRPADRIALGNEVCRIDSDGFREPGPARTDGRKLAFLVGGSTAFGVYASSDRTTITSYLNRLQNDYFFVTAGVPAWNSTQQLQRVMLDLVNRQPALVVALDGANDAILARLNTHRLDGLPVGTPHNFADFERAVEERRHPAGRAFSWFPELGHRLETFRAGQPPPLPEPTSDDLDRAVRLYRDNHLKMDLILRGSRTRFVTAFQPVAALHRRIDRAFGDANDDVLRAFHERLRLAMPPSLEFYDLSAVFDTYLEDIPVLRADLSDDLIFLDSVHLYDRGNEMLARHLWPLLAAGQ